MSPQSTATVEPVTIRVTASEWLSSNRVTELLKQQAMECPMGEPEVKEELIKVIRTLMMEREPGNLDRLEEWIETLFVYSSSKIDDFEAKRIAGFIAEDFIPEHDTGHSDYCECPHCEKEKIRMREAARLMETAYRVLIIPAELLRKDQVTP